MLAFERQWWRRPGAKETAIRDRFGLAPTRYYQMLNALVDRPAALEADPLLVRRGRRPRPPGGQRRAAHVLGDRGRGPPIFRPPGEKRPVGGTDRHAGPARGRA